MDVYRVVAVSILAAYAEAVTPLWPALLERCESDPYVRREFARCTQELEQALRLRKVTPLFLACRSMSVLARIAAARAAEDTTGGSKSADACPATAGGKKPRYAPAPCSAHTRHSARATFGEKGAGMEGVGAP